MLTVLAGVLVAFAAHQIARGGWRWRSLSVAGHELDVAAKLPPDDVLADELRAQARTRLERYTRDRGPWYRRPALAVAVAVLEFGAGIGAVVVAVDGGGGGIFLVLAIALFVGAIEVASRALVLRPSERQ